jgi:nucleoside-diphosphate-sugar epimerase
MSLKKYGENMKVLFIGGTGVISSACSQLAVEHGIELYLFNRGQTRRDIPVGAHVISGDIRDVEFATKVLANKTFDAIVDWIAYTPEHIEADIKLFSGKTKQFVFISSASVYQKPVNSLPITESTPLYNPFWEYSRNKIAIEERLNQEYQQNGFPITIVRPSHTYDKILFPFRGGYAVLERMLNGQPIIIHGDGTSLWTMTHHSDFAKGFLGLLGNPQAIGEAFHITSDEILCWNQIFEMVADAAGVKPNVVHIPSDFVAKHNKDWGDSLLGDKSHSVIFDNTKIKRMVPKFKTSISFWQGAKEVVDWYVENPVEQSIDHAFMNSYKQILNAFTKL